MSTTVVSSHAALLPDPTLETTVGLSGTVDDVVTSGSAVVTTSWVL